MDCEYPLISNKYKYHHYTLHIKWSIAAQYGRATKWLTACTAHKKYYGPHTKHKKRSWNQDEMNDNAKHFSCAKANAIN